MSTWLSITQSRTEEIIGYLSINPVDLPWTNAQWGHGRNISLRTRPWELTLWVPDISVSVSTLGLCQTVLQMFKPSSVPQWMVTWVNGQELFWAIMGQLLPGLCSLTFEGIFHQGPLRLGSQSWVMYLNLKMTDSASWSSISLICLIMYIEQYFHWPPICLIPQRCHVLLAISTDLKESASLWLNSGLITLQNNSS